MRKIISFLIFLIIIFIVNLVFYYLSNDYRVFLSNLKNPSSWLEQNFEENSFNDDLDIEVVLESPNENIEEEIYTLNEANWEPEIKKEVTLWKNYIEILDLFSIYNLTKLELSSILFDITDEYPDQYYEYYSKDLTLYMFPWKNFNDIIDIFLVLSEELPFDVNQVNNFWEKSFYINLNDDIQDRYVRIVVSNNWVVLWLKVNEIEYNFVKEKLDSLIKN